MTALWFALLWFAVGAIAALLFGAVARKMRRDEDGAKDPQTRPTGRIEETW